jgi:hypothetical protein
LGFYPTAQGVASGNNFPEKELEKGQTQSITETELLLGLTPYEGQVRGSST